MHRKEIQEKAQLRKVSGELKSSRTCGSRFGIVFGEKKLTVEI